MAKLNLNIRGGLNYKPDTVEYHSYGTFPTHLKSRFLSLM